jgi:hypothetical protein
MPYRQNCIRGNDPFEVETGAGFTLFAGSGNRRLLLDWCLEGKQRATSADFPEFSERVLISNAPETRKPWKIGIAESAM